MVVPVDEPQRGGQISGREVDLDQIGDDLADEQRGPGTVAVVTIVAHLQRLGEDRGEVHGPVLAQGRCEHRGEDPLHPSEPLDHLRAVGAEPQDLAESLVERDVGGGVVDVVVHHEHRHRRAHHSGHRSDGVPGVVRREAHRGRDLFRLLHGVGQPLVDERTEQRPAQRTGGVRPLDRRASVEELASLEPERITGPLDRHQPRPGGREPADGFGVGAGRPRVGHHRRQRLVGAGDGRSPLQRRHLGRLRDERVRKPARPGCGDRGWFVESHHGLLLTSPVATRAATAFER